MSLTNNHSKSTHAFKPKKSWCFTTNNYTEEHVNALKAITEVKYLIFGKEIAETGTPHLQGFIQFKTDKSLKQVTTLLPGSHCEPTRGTACQAADYCKKDGDFYEYGKAPVTNKQKGENEKKRYERAWEIAKDPYGNIEDIDADIRYRLYGTLKRIRADHQPVLKSMPNLDNNWYCGPSGTGKSRKAREENPDAFIKNVNKWWDGFADQPCVIIEEWNPDIHVALQQYLKSWCDHHPFNAETKGSTMCIRPKKIIVTSNYTLEECFGKDEKGLLEPLRRRFKVTKFGDHPFNPIPANAECFNPPPQ